MAFDQETIDVNYQELTNTGVILADAKFDPVKPEDSQAPLFAVPFTEIARAWHFIDEKYGSNWGNSFIA